MLMEEKSLFNWLKSKKCSQCDQDIITGNKKLTRKQVFPQLTYKEVANIKNKARLQYFQNKFWVANFE